MKKVFFLLLIIILGFTSNDVRDEIITLDWQIISDSELKEAAGLDFTFENAAYPEAPKNMQPVFTRSYPLTGSDQDYRFVVENPVFREIKSDDLPINCSFPDELEIGTAKLKSGDSYRIEIQIPAAIKREGKVLLLKEFKLKKIPVRLKSSAAKEKFNWEEESILNSGKWLKISTSGKGIYTIPYTTLNEWGFSNPAQVKVFGAGGTILSENPGNITYDDLPQVAVWHGQNNGTDCLFFFAPGTTKWLPDQQKEHFVHELNHYSKQGYFFLTESAGAAKRIEPQALPEGGVTHSITSFDAYDLYEQEKYNLLRGGSGKQWFGDKFITGTTNNISFELNNLDNSAEVSLRIIAAARSSASSEMPVAVNQTNLGKLSFSKVNTSDATAVYANQREERYSFPAPNGNQLNTTVKYFGSTSNAEAWLDFIELNYRQKLKLSDNVLFFRDLASVGTENVLEFKIETDQPNLKVWNVTDIFNVKEIQLQINGNNASGIAGVEKLCEFAAFDPSGTFPEPELVGEVENQNLHGLETPEFLIVSYPAFLNTASELADFHRSYDGMKVEVVSSEKVYNEFSSGNKSATGIRNFIKMFYDRDEGMKYVLLFGDGSYDNRNIKGSSNNFIPTFQSENSLSPVASFVTDDYFVILDDDETVYNGAVDLGLGRIPASTNYQAQLVMNKIYNYYSAPALGSWRNVVCFIADDEDGSLHMSDSEKLADIINEKHREFITDKIYFDAYPQVTGPGGESYPRVTEAINERVKNGVLVLNYVGHANERFMADEKVLDISHINSWSNANTLPIFVTATCEFSRFDSDETSAGEYVLLNPNGGGIGLFSTTRLVFAYSNFLLSRSFYNHVFEKDENGEHYRMGDIMRLAKINTINTTNKRNFSLLADPALKLSFPKYKVVTSTINGHEASIEADTLGAMQNVTVTGYIADESGNKFEDFSGEIVPTVFDKEVVMETLGNAGETPMEFKVQENVIYKGLTEVQNGEFTFSFVIPKDISYSLGEGKIIYYAHNSEVDAHGAFENFYIGGPGSQITDNEGPEIQLYLDSPDFEQGDKVSKNPTLFAQLSDENGINTAGAGIGHDITAVIDNDYSNAIVLNSFYQANPGDHSSGNITYNLRNLSVGEHTLKLKAWDVANNSSEVEIDFYVSGDFVISEVSNYPNPVYDYTYFTFEHNQAGATLEAVFEIFDQNGRRVDYYTTQVGSSGTRSNPVRWDLNESGLIPASGIYILKVTAQNRDGVITTRSGKMVIGR
ncbi:MAG: type IX secretion system sortase PorU [Bacteroidota bacterium]